MVHRPEHSGSTPLLERESELASAAKAVDSLCAAVPSGGLLVYRGAAGLGKTTLLSEIRRLAAGRCTVWSARSGETVTSVPFHVVRQLLQPAVKDVAGTDPEELLGDRYEIVGPALGIAAPGGPNVDPQGVRDGLDCLVDRLAERGGPLLLLVDDAHWADLETLTWLASFAQRPGNGGSVLVVVAYRTEEAVGETARLLQTLGTAAKLRVTLRALTSDATAELARATLGEEADDPFCREVWAVTGGNAYETVELLAKVQESGLEPVEESAHELRALGATARGRGLIARLEELGAATTKFAWAAAILNKDISLDLAISLAGMEREEAVECAERLRAARILVGTDPMEFVHPLIAGAVYRAIPSAMRTAMHGLAAWAVTRSGRGAAAAAPHLLEVHPDNDAELVQQLREAASENLAVGAPDAARRCLERALAEPPLPAVRPLVLYELGCATLLTSPATTVGHLRAALATPDLDEALRVDVVFRLSQALTHNNQSGEAADVVVSEAARLEPGPDRMRLHAAHFLWQGVQGIEDDGLDRSRRLTELASGLTGRDNTERVLLMLRAFDGAARGESAEEIVQIAERVLLEGRLAPGVGWTDTEWGFEPPSLLGLAYAFADRLDRAESLFVESLRAFEISGWSGGHLAFAHALVGYRQPQARSARGSRDVSAREPATGRPGGRRTADALGRVVHAHRHTARPRPCRPGPGGRRALRVRPPYASTIVIPDAPSVRGRLLLALGRTKEAIAELEAAGEALLSRGTAQRRHGAVGLRPRACARRRTTQRAADLAGYVRDRAERFGTHTAIGVALCLPASLEEGPAAIDLLAQAVDPSGGLALPRTNGRCALVEYGIVAGIGGGSAAWAGARRELRGRRAGGTGPRGAGGGRTGRRLTGEPHERRPVARHLAPVDAPLRAARPRALARPAPGARALVLVRAARHPRRTCSGRFGYAPASHATGEQRTVSQTPEPAAVSPSDRAVVFPADAPRSGGSLGTGDLGLRADCGNCFGLCCVALTFSVSADFAVDKESGEPCRHLGTDFRCGIHQRPAA